MKSAGAKPKDKQRLSSVHLLGNCGFKEQQEEAAKRHGCHTGERAGSGIGEARIEQINACKTEDRRKQRIEWHSEGPLRAGIAPAENEKGNSDKKEKAQEEGHGIFNNRHKSVAGERTAQHTQERDRAAERRVGKESVSTGRSQG